MIIACLPIMYTVLIMLAKVANNPIENRIVRPTFFFKVIEVFQMITAGSTVA